MRSLLVITNADAGTSDEERLATALEVLREKAASGVPVIFSSHQLDLVQRLCDRVGIIAAGSMKAVGTVDELRGSGNAQLEVHAPAATPGWADGIPGVETVDHSHGTTLLSIKPGTDDQAILHAALATGPVHEFSTHKPSLSDLFREAVEA